jgi:Transcriptional regulatory protein, C terminal
LDPTNAQLWRNDEKISLRRKTFDVLLYLVDHPGQLVTKASPLDALWADVTVTGSMPAICVADLRKALGDEARTPRAAQQFFCFLIWRDSLDAGWKRCYKPAQRQVFGQWRCWYSFPL